MFFILLLYFSIPVLLNPIESDAIWTNRLKPPKSKINRKTCVPSECVCAFDLIVTRVGKHLYCIGQMRLQTLTPPPIPNTCKKFTQITYNWPCIPFEKWNGYLRNVSQKTAWKHTTKHKHVSTTSDRDHQLTFLLFLTFFHFLHIKHLVVCMFIFILFLIHSIRIESIHVTLFSNVYVFFCTAPTDQIVCSEMCYRCNQNDR